MRVILKSCFLILIISLCTLCRCYKILVVFPMLGRSHKILGDTFVDVLLNAGHQVTFIAWDPSFMSHPNLTVIDIKIRHRIEQRYENRLKKSMNQEGHLQTWLELTTVMSELQRNIMENEQVQNLLNDKNQNFDVAILEWLFGEYIVGMAAVFGCPYIWFAPTEPHFLILNMVGEFIDPANEPKHVISTLERVRLLLRQLSIYLFKEFYIQPIEEKEYQRVVAPLIVKRQRDVPDYNELRYNGSLILGNSHNSVGQVIKLPQAYKAIGGYHVKKIWEPLPKDLQTIMDNSTNGVIYFSMGSFLKSIDFPEGLKEELLKVFSNLKQTIIWKYETNLPNKPNNVHIVSWSPQQSILAHPNCVLFISHGGLLSSLEAMHYGVPLIGIPVFGDQHMNVKTLVNKGVAKGVSLSYNMAEDLKTAIQEVLENSSYAEAMKRYSFVYHHRVVPPEVELLHWVEHVIETRGALHLRPIHRRVKWYQKYYLDVATVIAVILILLVLLVKWVILKLKLLFVKNYVDSKKML